MINFFKTSLKLQGFPLSNAARKLKAIREIAPGDFVEWQHRSKWQIFEYHLKNNPFYQQFTGGKRPVQWEEVPVLCKADYQRPLELLLSNDFHLKNIYKNNTSGSSGHPFFFAKDKFCHALTWAIIQDRYSWHGIHLGNKQARFYGIPLTRKGYIKEKFKDLIGNRERFPVFDMSDRILEAFLDKFRKTSFIYLYGYTSAIALFAKFLLKKKVVLKDVCPTLKACVVTSEVCTPGDRNNMYNAFGVKVVNEYGASELDFIAFEDAEGDWITTDESLFIEILDDQNNPLPPGQEGKVVITSLFNHAMPFIRYEIGDYAQLKAKKKGNHNILEKLSGRTNDFAILPSGKKSAGLTFYYVSKSLLEIDGVMKEFIIRQKTPVEFVFEYVAERDLNETEKNNVRKMMDMYLEPGLVSIFQRKNKIERKGSGKIKHFYYEVNS